MQIPEKQTEFSLDDCFGNVAKLRHLNTDKMWISSEKDKIVLVNKAGTTLHEIDTNCYIAPASGMYVSHDRELIFIDKKMGSVRKVTQSFEVTTLFTITSPRKKCSVLGICQLQTGDWVVCMTDDGVYDGDGKVIREIGQGHLQGPHYVTVNRVNDDICVSDKFRQVIVFSSSSEKRFAYTGHDNTDTGFTPWDLCCDRLGNILIIDYAYHRVHIIDRDGHFLQYLVSGEENIPHPSTIDIDERGYAWIGEYKSRKVKAYKYLS